MNGLRPDHPLSATAYVWARAQDEQTWPAMSAGSCCGGASGAEPKPAVLGVRARLEALEPHLHCSVIGTCLSDAELRKELARFADVQGMTELAVHHEAVRLASEDKTAARALHKALDQRHDAALQRFSRAQDEAALSVLWQEALQSGEVPGAYWALLTHRRATPALREAAFGDVHMLSHLMGSTRHADARRLAALEQQNTDLGAQLARAQARQAQTLAERDAALAQRDAALQQAHAAAALMRPADEDAQALQARIQKLQEAVGLQAQRREAAEREAQALREAHQDMEDRLAQLKQHAAALATELAATEQWLHGSGEGGQPRALHLQGRRLLYVGGRPSSTPAIRDLVRRAGAEFRRHDGGIEDRKGMLHTDIAWADIVAFPVDCIDHDSALALKRECLRQGKPFLAMRCAGVASLLGALAQMPAPAEAAPAARPALRCLRNA